MILKKDRIHDRGAIQHYKYFSTLSINLSKIPYAESPKILYECVENPLKYIFIKYEPITYHES